MLSSKYDCEEAAAMSVDRHAIRRAMATRLLLVWATVKRFITVTPPKNTHRNSKTVSVIDVKITVNSLWRP